MGHPFLGRGTLFAQLVTADVIGPFRTEWSYYYLTSEPKPSIFSPGLQPHEQPTLKLTNQLTE